MKDILANIFGFVYTLSMGDYVFFIGTFLIILAFIYVLYLLKKEDNRVDNEDISYLENVKSALENNYKPEYSNITEYEKEQEENAIISYEELLKNKVNNSYEEEYINNDDVIIKKINITETNNVQNNEKINVQLLKYNEYEDFLSALKKLQQKLSN